MKGGKQLNRKGLAVGLILVFIVSMVVPMVIGNPTRSMETYNKYNLDAHRFPEGYPKKSLPYGSGETTAVQNPMNEEPGNPVTLNGGLLDSSWPMYCHDVRHTGQSQYNTLNTTGVEKWRMPLTGWTEGSPAIDKNDVVYIGCDDLYAIYPNGSIKWRFPIDGSIWSAPAIDENGVIYVGAIWSNYFYAINPNGSLKWIYGTGGWIYSSPVIGNDGTIYFGDEDAYINALFPNGTLRWKYQTLGAVLSSPAIGDDGTIYCGSHDSGLYALYPNNGTVKWRFGTGGWVRTAPCIAQDETIYCVSLDNYLYAVYPNGTMKWRTNVDAGTSPTIGQDGTIYAGWEVLHALNPSNGSIKWSFNPGSGRVIESGTPAHSADGTIYLGVLVGEDAGGEIIAVNPNGTEKWRKMIADFRVQSAPAISKDGTVYIGSSWKSDNSYLDAFGPGEQKTIAITQPKPGGIYLLGFDLGNSRKGKTIILGSVTVKAQPSIENEIDSVSFIVDGSTQNTTTKPPFEWHMNKRYWKWPPLMHLTITVTASYKGGCTWSDSRDVWYFHLRHNYPK